MFIKFPGRHLLAQINIKTRKKVNTGNPGSHFDYSVLKNLKHKISFAVSYKQVDFCSDIFIKQSSNRQYESCNSDTLLCIKKSQFIQHFQYLIRILTILTNDFE